jgi:hypothetical protein
MGLKKVFVDEENYILRCDIWPHNTGIDYQGAYDYFDGLIKTSVLMLQIRWAITINACYVKTTGHFTKKMGKNYTFLPTMPIYGG